MLPSYILYEFHAMHIFLFLSVVFFLRCVYVCVYNMWQVVSGIRIWEASKSEISHLLRSWRLLEKPNETIRLVRRWAWEMGKTSHVWWKFVCSSEICTIYAIHMWCNVSNKSRLVFQFARLHSILECRHINHSSDAQAKWLKIVRWMCALFRLTVQCMRV